MNQPVLSIPVRNAIEISVYLLLIYIIVAWCLQIVMPFVSFIAWGVVIAVATHKPFLRLKGAVGSRNKLAVVLFTVLGLVVIVVPTWMFAGSLIDSTREFHASLQSGDFEIPEASEQVKSWPLVGEKLYANWSEAAENFEGWLEAHREQVRQVAETVVGALTGIGLSVVQFVAAVLIAAALLANEQRTRAMMQRFCRRVAGEKGDEMLALSAATIRSVAVGVLGIAFIQAFLGGLGMVLAGVPAAGVWALIILVLAIAQLPPLLVLLPAIFYVFSVNDSTAIAIAFTVWSLAVSFSDAVLKPILLGRGVEAPMLVILLGAVGGMLHSGIIGLFLGAVILALGYKLFVAWMEMGGEAGDEPDPETTREA